MELKAWKSGYFGNWNSECNQSFENMRKLDFKMSQSKWKCAKVGFKCPHIKNALKLGYSQITENALKIETNVQKLMKRCQYYLIFTQIILKYPQINENLSKPD